METALTDFPKLYCPFIRQTFQVDPGPYRLEYEKSGLPDVENQENFD